MTASDNDRDEAPGRRPGAARFSVLASAPVRTADAGGWSDTWFAEYGLVCNVAIELRAQVRVDVDPMASPSIVLDLRMTGERYEFGIGSAPGLHPMIEAAAMALAPRCGVIVEVAETLDGSGLGTSSAMMVALVAALQVAAGGEVDPNAVVAAAHRFETVAGREAGVQDHVAAAFGGISLIAVDYPRARRRAVTTSAGTLAELQHRLITVWFGRSHQSSTMHDEVIARLVSDDASVALDRIRDAAHLAAEALAGGHLEAYASALVMNHDALGDLHPLVVSDEARELIELARAHGAIGWKSIGAGGAGGSMVLVGPPDRAACGQLRAAVDARRPWRCIDARIATHGVIARRFAFDDAQLDSMPDRRGFGGLS